MHGDAKYLVSRHNSATEDRTSPATHDLALILIIQAEVKMAADLLAQIRPREPVFERRCESDAGNEGGIGGISSIN